MYRVFQNFEKYPPPYDKKPPPELKDGVDYETSTGTTEYDWTWKGPGGVGAMKEHYEKRCLPIFPFANNYTCSFISLGDMAFFVVGDDRPTWMKDRVCIFSNKNHPPERDFIKHLPYAKQDGDHLKIKVLGYSFWVNHDTGQFIRAGVSPDLTDDGGTLFGYAFEAAPRLDSADQDAAPYQHPQSFYFSGDPGQPYPDAPIVSQNYTDFAMRKPPPSTWEEVSKLDPTKLLPCHLFDHVEDAGAPDAGGPPPSAEMSSASRTAKEKKRGPRKHRTWGTMGQHR
jgi:hypothetical protein